MFRRIDNGVPKQNKQEPLDKWEQRVVQACLSPADSANVICEHGTLYVIGDDGRYYDVMDPDVLDILEIWLPYEREESSFEGCFRPQGR